MERECMCVCVCAYVCVWFPESQHAICAHLDLKQVRNSFTIGAPTFWNNWLNLRQQNSHPNCHVCTVSRTCSVRVWQLMRKTYYKKYGGRAAPQKLPFSELEEEHKQHFFQCTPHLLTFTKPFVSWWNMSTSESSNGQRHLLCKLRPEHVDVGRFIDENFRSKANTREYNVLST